MIKESECLTTLESQADIFFGNLVKNSCVSIGLEQYKFEIFKTLRMNNFSPTRITFQFEI